MPDVDHHHERGTALAGRERPGVGFRLAAGAQYGVVEALGVGALLELLGLEDEGAATVQVDPPGAGAAVPVGEGDRPLEHVVLLGRRVGRVKRSEEHTSELQSLMRISYAVFCLKKKKNTQHEELT